MKTLDKDIQMRGYIMDSLIARSCQTLTAEVISEIAQEILQRMIEVHEPPIYKECKDFHEHS